MKRLVASLAVVSVCNLVCAQDFPSPKPTEVHKILARDAGIWDADVRMYVMGTESPPAEYKGVETNELVSDGLFLRSTFKSKMGDRDFEGHGLLGYDPRTKEYTGTWVDNFNAVPMPMKATYDAEKKTLTTLITSVDVNSGQEFKQKQITTYVDENNKTFAIYLLVENGDQTLEVKLMDMTARKRK